jgi:hypothetical protein
MRAPGDQYDAAGEQRHQTHPFVHLVLSGPLP